MSGICPLWTTNVIHPVVVTFSCCIFHRRVSPARSCLLSFVLTCLLLPSPTGWLTLLLHLGIIVLRVRQCMHVLM